MQIQQSKHSRLHLLAFLLVSFSAFAQSQSVRVAPEEAAKQLIRQYPAEYPAMAKMANISGEIVVEIRIDESGSATCTRLIEGHPMLAPSAMQAVTLWKYRPFLIGGKLSAVVTLVDVTIGISGTTNHSKAQAEMTFQHGFWTASDGADTALANRDFVSAAESLKRAGGLVSSDKGLIHSRERWHWMTAMANLSEFNNERDKAEQFHSQALALMKESDKESPEYAASLASLGKTYLQTQRLDLARENFNRSVVIYRKAFKRVGSDYPSAKAFIGQEIAHQSSMLVKLALEQNDGTEVKKQCRTLQDFQAYLIGVDREAVSKVCTAVRP